MINHELTPLKLKSNPKEEQTWVEHQEMRAIRHPTKIEKLRNAIRPAVNVLPPNSLPAWKDYPLEKKFPRVPAPNGEFIIGRNALGENIFVSGCKFDTDDPHMIATPHGYESLHDPHLKDYFMKHPRVFDKLVEHGLVEEDGTVNTSMKEFNQYRAYLGRLKNCDVSKDLGYKDKLGKAERDQLRKIVREEQRAVHDAKNQAKQRHLERMKLERERRELAAQLKDVEFFERSKEKEREAAILAVKREALRDKVRARLAKLKRAERKRARRLILEFYCRQLYADMMRKARREHKKQLHDKDLESFINAKRQFQATKLKWFSNLEQKREAERECGVKTRIKIMDKLEAEKVEKMKQRVIDAENRAKREVYLLRKFGLRWLALVRRQREYAKNYHESVWRIRQQLVEMVQALKNENGKVSFTAFMKGLQSMKLKTTYMSIPDMAKEMRDIMRYILDLLIKSAFDTYKKQHKPCDKAYQKLGNRRRILGEEDLTEADFKDPGFKMRDKVYVPFEKPYFPCKHPCTKLGVARFEEDPCCEDDDEALYDEAEELADDEIMRLFPNRGRLGKEGKGDDRGMRVSGEDGSEGSSGVAEKLVNKSITNVADQLQLGKGKSKEFKDMSSPIIEKPVKSETPMGKPTKRDVPMVKPTKSKVPTVMPTKSKVPTAMPTKSKIPIGKSTRRISPPATANSSHVAEDIVKSAVVRSSKSLRGDEDEGAEESEEEPAKGSERKFDGVTADDISRLPSANSSNEAEDIVKTAVVRSSKSLQGEDSEKIPQTTESEAEPDKGSEGKIDGVPAGDDASEGSSGVAENLVNKSITSVADELGKGKSKDLKDSSSTVIGKPTKSKIPVGTPTRQMSSPSPAYSFHATQDLDKGPVVRSSKALKGDDDVVAGTSEDSEKEPPPTAKSEQDRMSPEDDTEQSEEGPGPAKGSERKFEGVTEDVTSPRSSANSSNDAEDMVKGALGRATKSIECDDDELAATSDESEKGLPTAKSGQDGAKPDEDTERRGEEPAKDSERKLDGMPADDISPRSSANSSNDAEDMVKGAVVRASKSLECDDDEVVGKAGQDGLAPEDADRSEEGPVKESDGRLDKASAGDISPRSSANSSFDAEDVVKGAVVKASKSLECDDDELVGKAGQYEMTPKEDTERSETGPTKVSEGKLDRGSVDDFSPRSSANSSNDAEDIVKGAVVKASKSLECDDDEVLGKAGQDGMAPEEDTDQSETGPAKGSEPKLDGVSPEKTSPPSTANSSNDAEDIVKGAVVKATKSLECHDDDVVCKDGQEGVAPDEDTERSEEGPGSKGKLDGVSADETSPPSTANSSKEAEDILKGPVGRAIKSLECDDDEVSCKEGSKGKLDGVSADETSPPSTGNSSKDAEDLVKGALGGATKSLVCDDDDVSCKEGSKGKLDGVSADETSPPSTGNSSKDAEDIVKDAVGRASKSLECGDDQVAGRSADCEKGPQTVKSGQDGVTPEEDADQSRESPAKGSKGKLDGKSADEISPYSSANSSNDAIDIVNSAVVKSIKSLECDDEADGRSGDAKKKPQTDKSGQDGAVPDEDTEPIGEGQDKGSKGKLDGALTDETSPPSSINSSYDAMDIVKGAVGRATKSLECVDEEGTGKAENYATEPQTDKSRQDGMAPDSGRPKEGPGEKSGKKPERLSTTGSSPRSVPPSSEADKYIVSGQMRDSVLRTLSNVQHQLEAIRQELRNYGILPRDPQPGSERDPH